MKKIYFLLDYLDRFSSKYPSKPYRSGMNKNLLISEFKKYNYEIIYLHYTDIDFRNKNYEGVIFLYTSSEDNELYYKSFIEDFILGLELKGAIVIPSYKFLRAHHNKVFMEILRDTNDLTEVKNIESQYFGTLEDLDRYNKKIPIPGVFKTSSGSTSSGVRKYKSKNELRKIIKKHTRTKDLNYEFRDLARSIRHNGYKKESLFRKKFLIQNLIQGLDRDWKILIFGEKYFVLERSVRKNDFRASGSGIFEFKKELPDGILNFAMRFFKTLNLPFLSLDVAYDGSSYYLIEFQTLYFGTVTLVNSPFYFKLDVDNSKWLCIDDKTIFEKEFTISVCQYLESNEI